MRSWSRIVNKNTSLLPEGGRIKKEISALWSRKMARLCERLVGYDRLVGEHASAATD